MSREAWIAVAVVVAIIGVVTLYGAIKLAKRLFITKRLLSEVGGTGGKIAFWGALIYTILPIDILPDPIYLDDMGILGLALLYMTHLLRKRGIAFPQLPRRPGSPPAVPTRTSAPAPTRVDRSSR